MTLEDRLRSHLDASARRLPSPPDRLDEVIRRGRRRRRVERAAVALALVALAVAVPASISAFRGPDVEFADPDLDVEVDREPTPDVEPGPGPEPTPDRGVEPTPDPAPAPTRSDDAGDRELAAPAELHDLGARVLAYGAYEHDPVLLVEPAGQLGVPAEPRTVHPGIADVALPDGRNGAVVQLGGRSTIVWYPDAHSDQAIVLVAGEDADDSHLLRAIDPDGRLIYSVRPSDDEPLGEDAEEHFFAMELAAGAEAEFLGSRPAMESWHVGPAWAASGPVHASCHLVCTLESGLVTSEGDAPLYRNDTAIEGLTATPDGRIVAFVEGAAAGPDVPQLVLLDGSSFEELARVPVGDEPRWVGGATVSLSADGERVLVGVGSSGQPPVPTEVYLVDGALGEEPETVPVEFEGAVRWFDPSAAVAAGSEPAEDDLAMADALVDLAVSHSGPRRPGRRTGLRRRRSPPRSGRAQRRALS